MDEHTILYETTPLVESLVESLFTFTLYVPTWLTLSSLVPLSNLGLYHSFKMRSSLTYALAILSAVGRSVQQVQVRDSYDYIIAGGGTAGLTVAARLAELDATVLVVEIGGEAADAVFWDYSQTLWDTDLTLWTGRGLGGSSSMNGTQLGKELIKDGWKPWDRFSTNS